MNRYIIGVYNGIDVDDYYINANSKQEAIKIASQYGSIYTVIEL